MTDANWMQPADEPLMRHLQREQPDYLPLVANRLGMHLGYVEERCSVLVDRGLVEPVSGEVVYRTTELGERLLAGEVERTTVARSD